MRSSTRNFTDLLKPVYKPNAEVKKLEVKSAYNAPIRPKVTASDLFDLSKPELKKLASQYKIKGRSIMKKDELFSSLYNVIRKTKSDIEYRIYETNLSLIEEKLRLTRVVKADKGIILQKPLKDLEGLTVGEVVDDEELIEAHNNMRDFAKKGVEQLKKGAKSNYINVVNLQYLYTWNHPDLRSNLIGDNESTMSHSKAVVVWQKGDFTKEQEQAGIDGYFEGKDSEGFPFLLGYRFTYGQSNNVTNLKVETIRDLKAYSPTNNREFHAMCSASTSNYKLCIYETFLDIQNIHKLKHSKRNTVNNDMIRKKLEAEGEEISKSVKNGDLINSLELLTKKYDTCVNIYYYGTKFTKQVKISELSEKPIMINKGVSSLMNDNEVALNVGKMCFLYEKNKHVAPFKFTYNSFKKVENIEKRQMTKFLLRPNVLKNEAKKVENILGYDIETYRDEKFNCVCYAICLYGKVNGENINKEFYGKNSVKLFINYLEGISTKINQSKTKAREAIPQINIYGFNNSRFDNIFIYLELFLLDPNTEFVFTGNSIKYMQYNNLYFFDISLFYACGDLRKTGKAFNLNKEKGVFPYKFPNAENLFYKGTTPELKYWNSKADYDEYINKNGDYFDMKDYTLKYCMLDSQLVYEIACYHIDNSVGKINGKHYNVMSCQTSANESKTMYQQIFQEDVLEQSPDHIIPHEKDAYKGGRTEAFKKTFDGIAETIKKGHKLSVDQIKFLNHYDISSAHPSGMTQDMPFKYIKSVKYSDFVIGEEDITDHFNYYAESKYIGGDEYIIPNLLIREGAHIIACQETKYAWHWGAEIKEALRNGFKITIKEVDMYEPKACFKAFAEYFYNERLKIKKTNGALSLFYKNIMNSLYGKFGQRQFNKSELFDSMNQFYNTHPADTNIFEGMVEVQDKLLISWKEIDGEYKSIGKLVRFSSYIAALTRCKLSEAMRKVGHSNIYYCDTDSIFTTEELPKDMVGNGKLGKWELEDQAYHADFLAPKLYQYTDSKGKNIKKSKGVKEDLLSMDDYTNLLIGKDETVEKPMSMFQRSLSNGVKILDGFRNVRCVYNKRIWEGNDSKAYKNITEWQAGQ